MVGIPKTIDKDLSHTDYTLGFDTALRNCTSVIEQARTPAGSHHWVQVVEVMGRHAGHLALWSAVAGGATLVLIPEYPFAYERVYALLTQRLARGPAGPALPPLCGDCGGRRRPRKRGRSGDPGTPAGMPSGMNAWAVSAVNSPSAFAATRLLMHASW